MTAFDAMQLICSVKTKQRKTQQELENVDFFKTPFNNTTGHARTSIITSTLIQLVYKLYTVWTELCTLYEPRFVYTV